ncbi:MAG: hypothetical protein ACW96S_13495 [Promethearchaeota archaeon]|jgi:hypothetical protein
MESLNHKFKKIRDSNNPEIINDFIIELSKNPNGDFLQFLGYLIENLSPKNLEKISLNLTFALGEIGNVVPLEEFFMGFLYETYHKSDRWIRNEVIQAFEKISQMTNLSENVVVLIGNAVNDEYPLIKLSALSALSRFKSLPHTVLRNLFLLMNSNKSELLDGCRKVFTKLSLRSHQLFTALDDSDNYKILKSKGIRSLLLIQFKSIINLDQFRDLVLNSGWKKEYKENFLREIDTFERILVKNM